MGNTIASTKTTETATAIIAVSFLFKPFLLAAVARSGLLLCFCKRFLLKKAYFKLKLYYKIPRVLSIKFVDAY